MKKILTIMIVLCLTLKIQAQSAIGMSLQIQDSILDGSAIYFNGYPDSVGSEDAIKFVNHTENIAIRRGNQFLAVEQRTTRVTTDLFLWNIRGLQYSLLLTKANMDVPVALEDRLMNTLTYFEDTPVVYTFASDSEVVYNRFRIVFPCVLAIDTTQPFVYQREKPVFNIYPNPSTNYLYIKGLPAGRHDLIITDTRKKSIFRLLSDGVNPIKVTHNLSRGMYYLSVNNITKPIIVF